jgi:ABC-2 type transport system ATP-binding protein
MPNAITIKNLSKTYAGGVQALKDINLEIPEGEFFALLGANGAGKTTIIGIMTDLVRKTAGKVTIFDYDIDTHMNQAKSMIGVVPQEFNFNIFEKVIDIVVNQAGYYGMTKAQALPRAHEVLEQLGLGEKKNVKSMELSGGMKRRLMIARALIHKPKLLILDEPTAGVDVELRHGMWEYLTKLNQEDGVTILLTTHYLEEVEQLCKEAAIIKEGEIVKKDTVKNLVSSLDNETYLVDTVDAIKENQIKTQGRQKLIFVDENTLEATVAKEDSINDLVIELDKLGVKINGIRPKGNRLEELFINLIKN